MKNTKQRKRKKGQTREFGGYLGGGMDPDMLLHCDDVGSKDSFLLTEPGVLPQTELDKLNKTNGDPNIKTHANMKKHANQKLQLLINAV